MKSYTILQKTISSLVICLSIASVAEAQSLTVTSPSTTNAVIELYTSEGCSSCPPADKWISNYQPAFKADDGVIALAFHVDYWNYLGWEDAYSKPEFTARQRFLGKINKQRTIYTPEFFVNATETRRTGKIPAKVAKINSNPSAWNLTLTSSTTTSTSKELSLKFNAVNQANSEDAELYLALYENNIVRKIGRGENKNKTLNHDFVVRDWIGPINFKSAQEIEYAHTISFPADSKVQNTGVAAILVDAKTGKTLQAVKSDLKTLFTNES